MFRPREAVICERTIITYARGQRSNYVCESERKPCRAMNETRGQQGKKQGHHPERCEQSVLWSRLPEASGPHPGIMTGLDPGAGRPRPGSATLAHLTPGGPGYLCFGKIGRQKLGQYIDLGHAPYD